MLGWLRSLFAPTSAPRAAGRRIAARYDGAQTTDENRRLWGQTDLLSAKAANSFSVRQILRRRSRYEVSNNGYANGIVRTRTNDLIGTGPTLQVTTPDAAVNKRIEAAFAQWAEAVGLTEKLRTISMAKAVDGEGFFVLRTNDRVNSPVKLYPLEIEADQVTNPEPKFAPDFWVDGVVLDSFGNPLAYDILETHPGDLFIPTLNPLKFQRVPARFVIQWFRKDRPGQVRGIPELTPALDLFAEIRAYRKSVVTAARIAAGFSAVLESEIPAELNAKEPEPFDAMSIENGMMTTAPWGMKLKQLHAEQPTTTFDSFVEKLLAEACRCVNVPLNVALGTSQKFNFSSARLDHVNYRSGLTVERGDCDCTVLNRLFVAWLDEALMIPGYLPALGMAPDEIPHEWHWPGWEPLDNLVDAQADTERLTRNMTLTFRTWCARQGIDWQEHFEQLAAEKDAREKLGLTLADVAPSGAPTQPGEGNADDATEPPAPKAKPKKKAGAAA